MRADVCMCMAPLGAEPSSPLLRRTRWPGCQQRSRRKGGETPPMGPYAVSLNVRLVSSPPLLCEAQYPRDRIVFVLSPTCLPCLHLSLTSLAGSYARCNAALNHVYNRCCVTTRQMSLSLRYMKPSEHPLTLRGRHPVMSVTLGAGSHWSGSSMP